MVHFTHQVVPGLVLSVYKLAVFVFWGDFLFALSFRIAYASNSPEFYRIPSFFFSVIFFYNHTCWEFFNLPLTGCYLLKSEWQKISSDPQDHSWYPCSNFIMLWSRWLQFFLLYPFVSGSFQEHHLPLVSQSPPCSIANSTIWQNLCILSIFSFSFIFSL